MILSQTRDHICLGLTRITKQKKGENKNKYFVFKGKNQNLVLTKKSL